MSAAQNEVIVAGSSWIGRGETNANLPAVSETQHVTEQTFSLRGILAGGLIGTLICFASIYYGLQAGQTNSMPLPSALLAYAVFRPFARFLRRQFNPNENVFVMTVASSMGGIPYTAGLSGTIPALEYLTTSRDNGPMKFTLWRLILWCLGVCLFGILFAAPFRKHFVLRTDLRFPTGTAMAAVISTLHKRPSIMENIRRQQSNNQDILDIGDVTQSRRQSSGSRNPNPMGDRSRCAALDTDSVFSEHSTNSNTAYQTRRIQWNGGLISFINSGLIALITLLVPKIQTLPVFGTPAAENWAWSVDTSPAYVGYGMIMHPLTTAHMLLGAVIGWAFLSPLAKAKGWAPGPVEEWESGSQGWTIWVSLGVILGDSLVGICWIVAGILRDAGHGCRMPEQLRLKFTQIIQEQPGYPDAELLRPKGLLERLRSGIFGHPGLSNRAFSNSQNFSISDERTPFIPTDNGSTRKPDPSDHNKESDLAIPNKVIALWFVGVTMFCILIMWFLFRNLLHIWEILLSIVLILPLGIASIRSMGDTDNALASTLGKIPQFLFALIIPKSNPNAIIISLLIGGIAEGGTYQSSDVMEHLKTGHLVGASPASLFYGQIIGSVLGAVLCSCVYKLFTSAYAIPSDRFTVPHAQLWLVSAHLAYGRGLPPGAWSFAVAGFILSAMCTIIRMSLAKRTWSEQIPSGIAIGIGIYILPMYTIPQSLGGLAHYWCQKRLRTGELSVIIIAVGLILGQSFVNILTLLLKSVVNIW